MERMRSIIVSVMAVSTFGQLCSHTLRTPARLDLVGSPTYHDSFCTAHLTPEPVPNLWYGNVSGLTQYRATSVVCTNCGTSRTTFPNLYIYATPSGDVGIWLGGIAVTAQRPTGTTCTLTRHCADANCTSYIMPPLSDVAHYTRCLGGDWSGIADLPMWEPTRDAPTRGGRRLQVTPAGTPPASPTVFPTPSSTVSGSSTPTPTSTGSLTRNTTASNTQSPVSATTTPAATSDTNTPSSTITPRSASGTGTASPTATPFRIPPPAVRGYRLASTLLCDATVTAAAQKDGVYVTNIYLISGVSCRASMWSPTGVVDTANTSLILGDNRFTTTIRNYGRTEMIYLQICDVVNCTSNVYSTTFTSFCIVPQCALYLCAEGPAYITCSAPWAWAVVAVGGIFLLWVLVSCCIPVIWAFNVMTWPCRKVWAPSSGRAPAVKVRYAPLYGAAIAAMAMQPAYGVLRADFTLDDPTIPTTTDWPIVAPITMASSLTTCNMGACVANMAVTSYVPPPMTCVRFATTNVTSVGGRYATQLGSVDVCSGTPGYLQALALAYYTGETAFAVSDSFSCPEGAAPAASRQSDNAMDYPCFDGSQSKQFYVGCGGPAFGKCWTCGTATDRAYFYLRAFNFSGVHTLSPVIGIREWPLTIRVAVGNVSKTFSADAYAGASPATKSDLALSGITFATLPGPEYPPPSLAGMSVLYNPPNFDVFVAPMPPPNTAAPSNVYGSIQYPQLPNPSLNPATVVCPQNFCTQNTGYERGMTYTCNGAKFPDGARKLTDVYAGYGSVTTLSGDGGTPLLTGIAVVPYAQAPVPLQMTLGSVAVSLILPAQPCVNMTSFTIIDVSLASGLTSTAELRFIPADASCGYGALAISGSVNPSTCVMSPGSAFTDCYVTFLLTTSPQNFVIVYDSSPAGSYSFTATAAASAQAGGQDIPDSGSTGSEMPSGVVISFNTPTWAASTTGVSVLTVLSLVVVFMCIYCAAGNLGPRRVKSL